MIYNNINNSFIRKAMSYHNTRPMGAFVFENPGYPDIATVYKLYLTSTSIGIYTAGEETFSVSYIDKSSEQIASELNGSPFPIKVTSLSNIQYIKEGELLVSASSTAAIPNDFDSADITLNGKGAIVRINRWAVRFNSLATVQVRAPYSEESVLPWWPRITVGEFSQRYNGIDYTFGVPEYKLQSWSSTAGYPFKDVEAEQVKLVKENKIKLKRGPIYWKGNNITITSNDGSKVYPSSLIKDVDSINGYVYLVEGSNVPNDANIYYTYLERHLLYKDVNLNAHFSQNPFLIDKFVLFYALPIRSNSKKQRERGIYHSIGNSVLEAINNITDVSMEEPLAILGAIHISPSIELEEANIVDTRSFGGGLREDAYGDMAKNKFPITKYFNDLSTYDGIPYHGSAAIVIELPSSLTSVLPLDKIKDNAKKFVAQGIYSIIDFVDESALWTQTDTNAEISLINYSIKKRTIPERTNLLNFTNGLMGASYASGQSLATPWEYSPDSALGGAEGLTGTLYPAMEDSIGKTGVWHLALSSGASDYNYLTKSELNLYQQDSREYYENDLGYFSEAQVITVEVKEDTCEDFGIYFYNEDTGEEVGNVFRWISNIPAPLSSQTLSTRFIREDWWRCTFYYEASGDELTQRRNIRIRPVASGDGSSPLPSAQYSSGLYITNLQVTDVEKDIVTPPERQVIECLYSGSTLDLNQLSVLDTYDIKYGKKNEAINWINLDQEMPTNLTGDALLFDLKDNPDVSYRNNVKISPGENYFIKYIKSSPYTKFFWEETDQDGGWKKKGLYDNRDVTENTLVGGKLFFTDLGETDFRYLTGFSPFVLTETDTFTDQVVSELHTLIRDLTFLSYTGSSYAIATGKVVDVVSGETESTVEVDGSAQYIGPETDTFYRSLLRNYDSLSHIGYFNSYTDDSNLLEKRALMFCTGAIAETGFPNRFDIVTEQFAATYPDREIDYFDELETYSIYLKQRMDHYLAETVQPGPKYDERLALLQSGLFTLATKIESVTSGTSQYDIGAAVRGPLFNPSTDTETALSGNYNEINTGISTWYKASDYIKGYSALYRTQDRPTIEVATGDPYLQFDISPLKLTVFGMAHSLFNLERFIENPIYNGEHKDLTWLYTYNRLDLLAGRFLENTSIAFDNIYYGNDEWAGWTGVNSSTTKIGPWHQYAITGGFASGDTFRIDTDFSLSIQFPDRKTRKIENQLPYLIEKYKTITDSLKPVLSSAINKGGILTPDLAKLIKSYLWIPLHTAKGDTYFAEYFDETDIEIYEDGMAALIKSMLSEDGRCLEGVSFKHDYIGTTYLPSETLYACIEGYEYYQATGDTVNSNRWLGMTEAIWNTTTGLYKRDYGYPVEIIGAFTSGDLGSRLISSMAKIPGFRSTAYTDEEFFALTGEDATRLS